MTTQTRNTISFITACFGTVASVFLVSVYIPGEGIERYALISGEAFLATSRLYLFHEGSAMNEVSRAKAKIAFRLSVIMSVALAVYGCIIYWVNPDFKEYALALFLMLQMGIPFVEWVFASRTGEQVNTVLVKLQNKANDRLKLAMHFRLITKAQAKTIQSNTNRINLLTKENSKQAERIAKLEQADQQATKTLVKLTKAEPKVDRVNGAPVCLCPQCLKRGELNRLVGGSRTKVLVCEVDGWKIEVPEVEPKTKKLKA